MGSTAITRRVGARRLVAGCAVLAIAIALLILAGMAVDRWPFGIDRAIMLSLRGWGGGNRLTEIAVQITALGSVPVLVLFVLVTAGLLFVGGRWHAALSMLAGTASGGLIVTMLKAEVARPRPMVVPYLVNAAGRSFPSGHAAGSTLVYLTLAALTAEAAPQPAVRRYVLAVAVTLAGAIGASRVYLGVHWPSDIVAGWVFGALWAWGCWLVTAGGGSAPSAR